MTVDQCDPMMPQRYRVQHVRNEIPDTFTLELEPEDGGDIPPFATGQFNMLYVFGVGEIPISISGDPAIQVVRLDANTASDFGPRPLWRA